MGSGELPLIVNWIINDATETVHTPLAVVLPQKRWDFNISPKPLKKTPNSPAGVAQWLSVPALGSRWGRRPDPRRRQEAASASRSWMFLSNLPSLLSKNQQKSYLKKPPEHKVSANQGRKLIPHALLGTPSSLIFSLSLQCRKKKHISKQYMHLVSGLGNSTGATTRQLVSIVTMFIILWFYKSFVNQYLEDYYDYFFFYIFSSFKVSWQFLSLKCLPGDMLSSP